MAWPNDRSQFIPQLLFNIYLHTLWGAVLALVFPDLRDHDMLGEVFNFFLGKGKGQIINKLGIYFITICFDRTWAYFGSAILYDINKALCGIASKHRYGFVYLLFICGVPFSSSSCCVTSVWIQYQLHPSSPYT
jgi:hypothetical protein